MSRTATEPRRLKREKKTVDTMIAMFCAAHHGRTEGMCADCLRLRDYALRRVDACPFGADKPTCLNCKVHCYDEDERDLIRRVMRHSGPRMLLKHPYLDIMHLSDGRSKVH